MEDFVKPTKTQALVEDARKALGGVTDYRLGKVMEINNARISDYRHGRRHADAYACARLALILKRDPLELIAEVEADSAKTPERKEFWQGFPSGLRRKALGVALSAIGIFSAIGPNAGNAEAATHNVGLRRKPERRKAPKGAFFYDATIRAGLIVAGADDAPKRSYIRP